MTDERRHAAIFTYVEYEDKARKLPSLLAYIEWEPKPQIAGVSAYIEYEGSTRTIPVVLAYVEHGYEISQLAHIPVYLLGKRRRRLFGPATQF